MVNFCTICSNLLAINGSEYKCRSCGATYPIPDYSTCVAFVTTGPNSVIYTQPILNAKGDPVSKLVEHYCEVCKSDQLMAKVRPQVNLILVCQKCGGISQ